MHINEAFPSKYVRAADLKNSEVTVVIATVDVENISPTERKLVMTFQGKQKGMVLNKTNANRIAYVYGNDTDDWIGKEIVLYPEMVEFQGRMVEAIRVKPPLKKPAKKYDLTTGNGAPVDDTLDDFR